MTTLMRLIGAPSVIGHRMIGVVASGLLLVLFALPNSWGAMGKVEEPVLAMPESVPQAVQEKVNAALRREGCTFLDGWWLNFYTTLRYSSSTKDLSLFLEDLAKCQGITLSVTFQTGLQDCDWELYHDAGQNRFQVRVNLNSPNINLEELYIPDIEGGSLAGNG